jgi:hypothetical protein
VNGFLCQNSSEAAALVPRLAEIRRSRVRADVHSRFTSKQIVDSYENLYRELVT